MRISSTQTQSNNLAWCCIIQETCSLEATGFTTDLLTTIGDPRYIFFHVPDFQVLMFGDSQKLISWIWTKDMLVYWDSIIVLLKSCEKISLGTIIAVFWPVYDLRFLIRKFTIKWNLNLKFVFYRLKLAPEVPPSAVPLGNLLLIRCDTTATRCTRKNHHRSLWLLGLWFETVQVNCSENKHKSRMSRRVVEIVPSLDIKFGIFLRSQIHLPVRSGRKCVFRGSRFSNLWIVNLHFVER